MNRLRGARLQAIRLDAQRTECRFDLSLTDQDQEHVASLLVASIQYSRFEFDETIEHEFVELVSIEAETCAVGIRLFGALSNGSFEFVCANFRIEA